MLRKSYVIAVLFSLFLFSCGNGENGDVKEKEVAEEKVDKDVEEGNGEKVEEGTDVDPMTLKGIGPIKALELGELDEEMAEEGEELFNTMCIQCHKINERYVGPALSGITERRTPEWIMNMILNPEEMVKEDPIAKDLLAEYYSIMANQNLTEEEARKILEYFRTI